MLNVEFKNTLYRKIKTRFSHCSICDNGLEVFLNMHLGHHWWHQPALPLGICQSDSPTDLAYCGLGNLTRYLPSLQNSVLYSVFQVIFCCSQQQPTVLYLVFAIIMFQVIIICRDILSFNKDAIYYSVSNHKYLQCICMQPCHMIFGPHVASNRYKHVQLHSDCSLSQDIKY